MMITMRGKGLGLHRLRSMTGGFVGLSYAAWLHENGRTAMWHLHGRSSAISLHYNSIWALRRRLWTHEGGLQLLAHLHMSKSGHQKWLSAIKNICKHPLTYFLSATYCLFLRHCRTISFAV